MSAALLRHLLSSHPQHPQQPIGWERIAIATLQPDVVEDLSCLLLFHLLIVRLVLIVESLTLFPRNTTQ